MKSLSTRVISIAGMLGVVLLLWACYSGPQVSYSVPQESTVNKWLIEFKTSESKGEV
jgi:hypothetical protein